jgi:hypothetical protein
MNPRFNNNITKSGYKRTHHHVQGTKILPFVKPNPVEEDAPHGQQDPNRIGSILSTLDQTLKELIKSQKTNQPTTSEYLLNSLLQQQS